MEANTSTSTLYPLQHLAVEPFPHQKEGIQWMLENEKLHGRGGILADDMGLGKSFQTLATIVNNPGGTTLIVLPLSLVAQWKYEIETKLTKALKVTVYHGTDRKQISLRRFDIVLTTYACLAREYQPPVNGASSATSAIRFHPYAGKGRKLGKKSSIKKSKKSNNNNEKETFPLMDFQWERVVLDECQNIKNGRSITALAAQKLQSRFRWCLSGTPIQNRPSEFMSLFRFVMGRNTNSVGRALAEMDSMILRRKKEDVLSLPDKDIQQTVCSMNPDEKKVYDTFEDDTKEKVYDIMHGGRSMMDTMQNILVLLLRMRQISNHPRLVFPESNIKVSSKQLKILKIIRRIHLQNPNEKIVVFSSFVEMLHIMEKTFQTLKWNYGVFDGSMNMKKRDAVLAKFRDDPSTNILLMSIKAGNVGLNLTHANTVIITEPWWNPFIDDQAMDRVHRIGQEKSVTIHKMIVEGTIEERILRIQEKKKLMFAQIFESGRVQKDGVRLSREEIEYLFDL